MSESYQLLGDRVLVRVLEMEAKVNGIIMPDSIKNKQNRAVIVAIGTGKENKEGRLVPPPMCPGQVVILDGIYGSKVLINGEELLLKATSEIIAIVG